MDETLIAELNAPYRCPPDAGPAWREAHEAGIDMSLIEQSLKATPWQRLVENDHALELVRMLEQARIRPHGGTD